MQRLATGATNRPNASREMTYADTGKDYRILGFIKIKFEGNWYIHVEYQALADGRKYSRDASEFEKFTEIIL
tara:strand:+ start:444 stop:659 length:216 start_codon:yes stop_codon:yes gene_type:complete